MHLQRKPSPSRCKPEVDISNVLWITDEGQWDWVVVNGCFMAVTAAIWSCFEETVRIPSSTEDIGGSSQGTCTRADST